MYRLVIISISLTLSIIDIAIIIFLYSTPFRPMCMYAHPLMHPVLLLASAITKNTHTYTVFPLRYNLIRQGSSQAVPSPPFLSLGPVPVRDPMLLHTRPVRSQCLQHRCDEPCSSRPALKKSTSSDRLVDSLSKPTRRSKNLDLLHNV